MSITKFNRVQETPKVQVTRKRISEWEADKPYTLLHVGVYQSDKYGASCYADIDDNGTRVRSSLPKRMIETINAMSHDAETMADIHAGKCTISVRPFETSNGFTTVDVTFGDKVEE